MAPATLVLAIGGARFGLGEPLSEVTGGLLLAVVVAHRLVGVGARSYCAMSAWPAPRTH